ncbi:hypothetical protein MVES_000635 [Malassezia vespertilionis]|uniref:ATP-dependent DNA ligase family profile domain-containing protein n=1 Tax=Malassezia vespertilionis TaxID=2020962 RepID=A0A2N1JGX7_9BASI|nr:hypothetical protein MVES_000635 [Malassezia vespertilionis]
MVHRVSHTNAAQGKKSILMQYPDLVPLLSRLYLSSARFHVSSSSLRKYMAAEKQQPPKIPTPSTLEPLLDALAARDVSGHSARDVVFAFLAEHGILQYNACETGKNTDTEPTVLEIFYRCLDRNLKAGFSHHSIRDILPSPSTMSRADAFLHELETTGRITSPMPIALAHSAKNSLLPPVDKHWFASRKLDGIRCLVIVTMAMEKSPHVVKIHTLSRSGRPFYSVDPLCTQLRTDLETYPDLASFWMGSKPKKTMHLVFDGELCALASQAGDETHAVFLEDFPRTVSAVRRRKSSDTTPILLYPFDCVLLDTFLYWEKHYAAETGPLFSQRSCVLNNFVSWCVANHPQTMLRPLEQRRVHSYKDVADMRSHATEQRWEGLMLRKDTRYEGRRTHAMIKVRDTQEAEYIVQDIELAPMRLSLHGIYAEHLALSSKAITVTYFRESETLAKSEDGTKRLRFPVVKAVYDSAERTT